MTVVFFFPKEFDGQCQVARLHCVALNVIDLVIPSAQRMRL